MSKTNYLCNVLSLQKPILELTIVSRLDRLPHTDGLL
jgi:hypothetical protein